MGANVQSITKETLIPLSLVMSALGLAYFVGSVSNRIDYWIAEVQAIRIDRKEKNEVNQNFQKEVLSRLSKIESKLESMDKRSGHK